MEDQSTDTWQKIDTWYLVLPPSRPSRLHLGIVRREMRRLPREYPVAVLGSTAEFRDLLYELGFKDIYVFDKYERVYQQMGGIRCYSNAEHLVLGDWLDTIPRFKNVFAAVLSDLTSGNVSYGNRPHFYASISRALRRDGLFIDKVLTHQGRRKSLCELERRYVQLPVNLLYVNYFSCDFLFSSDLLDGREAVDTSLFYGILDARFQSERLRKFLAESPKITPYGCMWFYGRQWGQIRKHYFSALEEVRVYEDESGSPYRGNLKLLISRKK